MNCGGCLGDRSVTDPLDEIRAGLEEFDRGMKSLRKAFDDLEGR